MMKSMMSMGSQVLVLALALAQGRELAWELGLELEQVLA